MAVRQHSLRNAFAQSTIKSSHHILNLASPICQLTDAMTDSLKTDYWLRRTQEVLARIRSRRGQYHTMVTHITEIAEKAPICYIATGREPGWWVPNLSWGFRQPRQPNLVKIEEHRAFKRADFKAGERWGIRTPDTLIRSNVVKSPIFRVFSKLESA